MLYKTIKFNVGLAYKLESNEKDVQDGTLSREDDNKESRPYFGTLSFIAAPSVLSACGSVDNLLLASYLASVTAGITALSYLTDAKEEERTRRFEREKLSKHFDSKIDFDGFNQDDLCFNYRKGLMFNKIMNSIPRKGFKNVINKCMTFISRSPTDNLTILKNASINSLEKSIIGDFIKKESKISIVDNIKQALEVSMLLSKRAIKDSVVEIKKNEKENSLLKFIQNENKIDSISKDIDIDSTTIFDKLSDEQREKAENEYRGKTQFDVYMEQFAEKDSLRNKEQVKAIYEINKKTLNSTYEMLLDQKLQLSFAKVMIDYSKNPESQENIKILQRFERLYKSTKSKKNDEAEMNIISDMARNLLDENGNGFRNQIKNSSFTEVLEKINPNLVVDNKVCLMPFTEAFKVCKEATVAHHVYKKNKTVQENYHKGKTTSFDMDYDEFFKIKKSNEQNNEPIKYNIKHRNTNI